MSLLYPVAALGRSTLALIAVIGRVTLYMAETLSHLVRPPFYFREFLSQLMTIGYFSLPVVGLSLIHI